MAEAHPVSVYQFKVVLRGVSPMIWRRILLRSDQTIADLHYAIQIAMGWSDSHLHRFRVHGKDYGVAHEGGIWFDDNPERVHLADFRFRLRERFLYEYDFYDLWEHEIRLEKILPWNGRLCPVCTGGRRLAPSEDCGGAGAYMEQGDPGVVRCLAARRVGAVGRHPAALARLRRRRASSGLGSRPVAGRFGTRKSASSGAPGLH